MGPRYVGRAHPDPVRVSRCPDVSADVSADVSPGDGVVFTRRTPGTRIGAVFTTMTSVRGWRRLHIDLMLVTTVSC